MNPRENLVAAPYLFCQNEKHDHKLKSLFDISRAKNLSSAKH